jgi:hypothetical protein
MVRLWTADVPDVLTTSQSPLAHTLSRCPPVAARAVASIIARESSKHPQTRLPADHSAQTSQCNISLAGNLQPHPQSATADTLSYASTRYSSICSFATVRSDPCLLRSSAKPMGEPLPPPQQQCAAPLPNRPEEEALHLDHPTPASADRQPPMQTSADAAAASTHADRQTDAPPVFWSTRHSRSTSYHSISHLGPGTIQLEDHSEEQHEQSQGCWARSVKVDDYTVVSGSSGLGAYVVWSLTVSTLKGGDMSIRKRYVIGFCCSAPGCYYCITWMRYVHMFHILLSKRLACRVPDATTVGLLSILPTGI